MSNELGIAKILYCPEDTKHFQVNSFAGLTTSNICYFVGVDVTNETNPQMVLSGDSNFAIGGIPIKSGLLELSTNSNVAWTPDRHISYKEHFGTFDT